MADLDKCLDGLRSLARSGDRNKLIEAELLIHDFIMQVASSSFTIRTSLASLDDAIIQEVQQNQWNAEFWQDVRAIIARVGIWIMTQAEEVEVRRLREDVSQLQLRDENRKRHLRMYGLTSLFLFLGFFVTACGFFFFAPDQVVGYTL